VKESEGPVVIQCKSCSKPIVIDCDRFHCVGCSVAMLHKSMAPRSKSERLRRWRKMAYEVGIMVLLFGLVNRYYGLEIQLVATGFYIMSSLITCIGDTLSRIF